MVLVRLVLFGVDASMGDGLRAWGCMFLWHLGWFVGVVRAFILPVGFWGWVGLI